MEPNVNMLTPFLDGGFEDFIETLTFIGTRVVTDTVSGKDYEEDDAELEVPDCVVQPYNDAQVSINAEGVRERVEKLVHIQPEYTPQIKVTDHVRDGEGSLFQIIFFKDWREFLEIKMRRL